MSFTLLRDSKPKARKAYPCIWCTEIIKAGESHTHIVGNYDGDFQDQRFHHECFSANQKFFKEDPYCDEFPPNQFKRGTTEEASPTTKGRNDESE